MIVDNTSIMRATLVKVDNANKHGSLLEVVQVLTDLNLTIICYVVDQHGNKLSDGELKMHGPLPLDLSSKHHPMWISLSRSSSGGSGWSSGLGWYASEASDFVDDYYTMETYRQAYLLPISTVRDKSSWEKAQGRELVQPPHERRPPGRPKKKRIRSSCNPEHQRSMRCSRCSNFGHNRRTCKVPLNAASRGSGGVETTPGSEATNSDSHSTGRGRGSRGRGTARGRGIGS